MLRRRRPSPRCSPSPRSLRRLTPSLPRTCSGGPSFRGRAPTGGHRRRRPALRRLPDRGHSGRRRAGPRPGYRPVLWTSRTASAVKVAPAVVGDLVVTAEVTGDVTAYRAETGEPLWVRPSSDPLRRFAWGAPTPAADSVVVGDQADLRRLDAATGKVIWRRTDLAPHHNLVNHAAPLMVGDLVAVGCWPSPQYPIGLTWTPARTCGRPRPGPPQRTSGRSNGCSSWARPPSTRPPTRC